MLGTFCVVICASGEYPVPAKSRWDIGQSAPVSFAAASAACLALPFCFALPDGVRNNGNMAVPVRIVTQVGRIIRSSCVEDPGNQISIYRLCGTQRKPQGSVLIEYTN